MKLIARILFVFFLYGLNVIKEDINIVEAVDIFPRSLHAENKGNGTGYIQDRSPRSKRGYPMSKGSCGECGRSNDKAITMIIGGKDVRPPFKYPWMVAIQKQGDPFCGGVIISDLFILTAAHCLKEFSTDSGEGGYMNPKDVNVSFVTETHVLKQGPPVESIIPHPKFSYSSINNDIALLKLRNKLKCSEFVSPICLPTASEKFRTGKEFTTAGWGVETPGERDAAAAKHLQQIQITNLDFRHCEKNFPQHMKQNYFCLKATKKTQSPCLGDSGGPMFLPIRKRYYAIGVSSMHVDEFCTPGRPFIYTSVPAYMQWIKQHMNGDSSKYMRRQNAGKRKQRCTTKPYSRKFKKPSGNIKRKRKP